MKREVSTVLLQVVVSRDKTTAVTTKISLHLRFEDLEGRARQCQMNQPTSALHAKLKVSVQDKGSTFWETG